jgi:CDP-paratose 2-epimerase
MNDILPAPGIARTKPILVTGGAGFIGCNLADRLATEGHDVLIYDSLTRAGVGDNLSWLKRRHPRLISAIVADIRDEAAVEEAASRASAVFHMAAQVAVTTSLDDPREDFEVNVRGTMLVLDALRRRPTPVPIVFASTNKVYGDLADVALVDDGARYLPCDAQLRAHGVSEDRAISFHTPYGCSKGAADQYVLDFARSFGLPTAVLRMSCIYGRRQRGTEDQGWVAHFLLRAMAGESITIYGDGRQVRDILFVDDAVAAYLAAWRRIGAVSGRAFNLGGGPGNAVSLLEVIRCIEQTLGVDVDLRSAAWRPGDQRYFVSDTRRATAALGLRTPLPWRQGVAALAGFYAKERGEASSRMAVGAD